MKFHSWILYGLMLLPNFVNFVFCSCSESHSVTIGDDGTQAIQSRMDGDYLFQIVMTLTGGDVYCRTVSSVGLLRVYAVKFAVEKINQDPNILPNVTLGYEINDGCLSVPVTMAIGIEFVRSYRHTFCYIHNDTCIAKSKGQNIAVIGAYYSYASIPLASLLSLHGIPQISYGSSSPLLSKKKLYSSFYRTIPSDTNQVHAFLEIMSYMNWTYVFAVASDDDYGKLAISDMKRLATAKNICIAGDLYIPHNAPETNLVAKSIVQKLNSDNKAMVVVMFGYAEGMADHILTEAENIGLRRFWLTSEGWNPHILKVNAPLIQLESVLTISLAKGDLPEFRSYLHEVVSRDYSCDVWLQNFISHQFGCNVTSRTNSSFAGNMVHNNSIACDVSILTVAEYIVKQNPNQVNNLIDAVYAIAHAMDAIVSKRCQTTGEMASSKTCIPKVSHMELLAELKNVSFTNLQKQQVQFDANGDIASVFYSIENLQYSVNGTLRYKPVGHWIKTRSKRLFLNVSKVQWPGWFKGMASQCSKKCQPGEHVIGKRECCWDCIRCPKNTVSVKENSDECEPCPVGHYTIDNTKCFKTSIVYFSLTDPVDVIAFTVCLIGLFVLAWIMIGYLWKRHTEVISSMPPFVTLCAFAIIFGLFTTGSFLLVKPNERVCGAKQIYFSIIFVSFAALLLVQNRSIITYIMKFVSGSKKYHSAAQFIVFTLLQSAQIFLATYWIGTKGANVEKHRSSIDTIREHCEYEYQYEILTMMMMAYPCLVLAVATAATFPDRKRKANYGITRYLNYVCVASSIVTVIYLLAMRHVNGKFQDIIFSLSVNAYGFIYLMCLLVPRLFTAFQETRRHGRESTSPGGISNAGYFMDELNPHELEKPFPQMTRL